MKINEFKKLLKTLAIENKKIPVLVEGEMGIGKSQAVQQVANEIGYHYIDLRLSQQEPGDLIGIPRINEKGETIWSKPNWIPDRDTKTVLALEELNRAPKDVQQAIFQALTEYKIHTHELPKYTLIVICINPSDSIYHVGSLDPAMLSRCLKVNLAVDVDEWIKYAYENKLDDRIIQFISVNRDLLCRPKAQEPCPLPRTWKLLSDIIKVIPEDISFDIISGLVGKEAAVTFQKFCDSEYKKPVSGKDILNRYKNVKEKLESQRNDETWVTVRDLLAVIGNSKLNKEQFNNLKQFLLDTKAEWKVEIITKLNDELLAKLAKTELVDDIAHIISQASKITKNK